MTSATRTCLAAWFASAVFLVGGVFAPLAAQDPFGMPDPFGGDGGQPDVKVSGRIVPGKADDAYQLQVIAQLAPGKYTYAMSQPSGGGPFGVGITVNETPGVTLEGEWTADQEPVVAPEPQFDNKPVHKLKGTITWSRPIRLGDDVDPASLEITGRAKMLVCDNQSCVPHLREDFTAKLEEAAPEPETETALRSDLPSFRTDEGKVTWQAYVEPAVVQPGGEARLVISATPDSDEPWHIFPLMPSEETAAGSKATIIAITNHGPLKAGTTQVNVWPESHDEGLDAPVQWYDRTVVWTIPLTVPEDAQPGEVEIAGMAGYQACLPSELGGRCQVPTGAQFAGTMTIGSAASTEVAALPFSQVPGRGDAPYARVRAALTVPDNVNAGAKVILAPTSGSEPSEEPGPMVAAVDWWTFSGYLLAAALGGFILNFMPCVLPVVGLKVMSFVSQAGQDRRRIFLLNLYYTFGVLAVFLVLASLTALPWIIGAFASLGVVPESWLGVKAIGWGQMFQSPAFVITLASLVWIMALSFLGVWEIPVPGFAMSETAGKMASKEGFSGAFSKGILATLLATPCTAPFLASATGFALTQPPQVIYSIFLAAGLGFASPYLLIGLQPSLIRYMPKPGEWMNTFKQVMGFFLLGTVAFLLNTFQGDGETLFAVFVLLLALWFGCWYVGRLDVGANAWETAHAWLVVMCVVSVIGFFAFDVLRPKTTAALGLGMILPLVWIGLAPGPRRSKTPAESLDWHTPLRRWAVGLAGLGAVLAVSLSTFNHKVTFPWVEPYSQAHVQELVESGHTVLVEFTADWCTNCIVKEDISIYTPSVESKVKANNVTMVLADWTGMSEEIEETIHSFGLDGIPLTVIYPAGQFDKPIVLPNIYTEGRLLEALDEAGPSKAVADDSVEAVARRP